jgi:sec-independent protein translocase protein TatA
MATGLLSPVHIAVVLVVVLLLFGAKRLPEMGKSLGSGLRGFKESLEGTPQQDPQGLAPAGQVAAPPTSAVAHLPSQPLESVGELPRPEAVA